MQKLDILNANRQCMARTTRITLWDTTEMFYGEDDYYVSLPDNFFFSHYRKEDLADATYLARLNDLAYATSEITYALALHNS